MAALPATLTMREARGAVQALEPAIGEGSGAVVIDAAALESFDSAAIATLLELRRQAQAAGRSLQVTGAPASMVDLAGLYGVAELLGLNGNDSRHSARA